LGVTGDFFGAKVMLLQQSNKQTFNGIFFYSFFLRKKQGELRGTRQKKE
jgi:hypothetical protein